MAYQDKLGSVSPKYKKEDLRLHYAASGNYAETGRASGLNQSVVGGVVGAHPIAVKRLSSKGNAQGAGRKF